jgi:RNA polymerase sigma factor (sigma-70 family)
MTSADSDPEPNAARQSRFATTRWSLVLAAQDPASPLAHDALASLCSSYWYPLYAYIRRQGIPADEAEDLTQEFFARLLEKDFLAAVDPTKGKFRAFLLAACTHFLANERDRARAWKRGGRCQTVNLDFSSAEARYGKEPAHELTAEKLFSRHWGLALLDQVLARLRGDFAAKGKALLFDRLRVCLLGEKSQLAYASLASELGMTEGAVRVAAHRMRQQFRELLREEIARTVQDPEHVDEEIRELFSALGP